MNFLLHVHSFNFAFLCYLISDILCWNSIVSPDKSVLATSDYNNSLLLGLTENTKITPELMEVKKITSNRRIRVHRKKKMRNTYLTTKVEPISDTSTIPSATDYQNKTILVKKKNRRTKLKKRRKGVSLKSKDRFMSQTIKTSENKPYLPSETAVLPLVTTQFSPTSPRQTTIKVKKLTRCSQNNGHCAHICNHSGKKKCTCLPGFNLAYDGHSCIDVNECLVNNGDCQTNCINTIGSYHCECLPGMRLGLDSKTCEDINECLLRNGHGPCQDMCENTHGGYKCSCGRLRGTKLAEDLHKCVDVNECAKDNGGCSHVCINAFGRSFCSCPDGMKLSADYKMCQDINECENDDVKKSCPNGCINTEGSYKCISWLALQNDESYANIVCKPLLPPQIGYYKCSRKHALITFAKSGRKRLKNSLGTRCILVCPEGFNRRGKGFRISCGYEGQWIGKFDSKCVSQSE